MRAAAKRLAAAGGSPLARAAGGVAAVVAACAIYAAACALPALPLALAFTAWLLPPALLVASGRTPPDRAPLRELAAVALLWLPIELHLLPPLPLPGRGGLDIARFAGLVTALHLFLAARPLQGVGYVHLVRRRELALAVAAFLLFAVVALPIGLATGFLRWGPSGAPVRVLLTPIIIYLATGIPEELLFRGLIQNLLGRWLGARAALPIASVVFGLAHLPDPRYVLLATLAGLAYGWVYQRTGKITAAAVTHALVDATWVVLLRG
ncbi:MAG TPA: CPBP family intramembrane glutamic endopeptidase [Gemmatimonadaceae bacterium]|nr:CPBP family intramembrane glutamic endopeptidase [Gemmatimonadaceae bacterium]